MLQIGICSECDNKLQKKSNMSLHKENIHETANSLALHPFEKETTKSLHICSEVTREIDM